MLIINANIYHKLNEHLKASGSKLYQVRSCKQIEMVEGGLGSYGTENWAVTTESVQIKHTMEYCPL